MKTLQTFSLEYLKECSKMTLLERLEFVENFQKLLEANREEPKKSKSKLISMKVPEDLLKEFRLRCEKEGVNYQTQIKKLMRDWLF